MNLVIWAEFLNDEVFSVNNLAAGLDYDISWYDLL